MNETDLNINEILEEFNRNIVAENASIMLLFNKKYRSRGKTEFEFFRGHHEGDARQTIKNILIKTVDEVQNTEIIDDFSEDNPDALTKIDLNNIDNWEPYEEAITNIRSQELEDLKVLKRSLNNFIISNNNEDSSNNNEDRVIIGQIRRIYPSQVLVDSDWLRFIFNNNVFNKAKDEEDSVKIDDKFDVLFIIKGSEKIALVKDQDSFNEIFDMHEQIQREALQVISNSNLYEFFDDPNKIEELVGEDRNIQNMLRNKVTMEGFTDISSDDLINVKEKLGDIVKFEINIDGKIILSSENEKESLKDIIKAAGYHYNESLYGEHIIEGRPTRKVN